MTSLCVVAVMFVAGIDVAFLLPKERVATFSVDRF